MIEYYTGLNPEYFIIGAIGFSLILFILLIVALVKIKNLKKRYREFMKGSDGKSLEETLIARLEQVDELIAANNQNERNIESIRLWMEKAIDKFAIVKYDALDEFGGNLSYIVCVLDDKNNGFIINYVHGRSGSYSYIKDVINGNTLVNLSDEEKTALSKAINGEDR